MKLTREPGFGGAPVAKNGGFRHFQQGGGFGESLRKAISQIDNDQKQAQNLATRFELGDPDASLTKVMMAQQTAQLSFRATVEMRNRIVQAYQDVMNMPM